MMALRNYLIVPLLIAGGRFSCRKDPAGNTPPPTKWQKISGSYKVYETTGMYLYDMSISHSDSLLPNGSTVDSLHFFNIGGCNFSTSQGVQQSASAPSTSFVYSGPLPTIDTNGNRWAFYGYGDQNYYYNTLRRDTIHLRYKLNNIQYWMSDMVPYVDTVMHQIAVKQH
jgi:hypothetical protein